MQRVFNTLFKVGDLIQHKWSNGICIVIGYTFVVSYQEIMPRCTLLYISPASKQFAYCEFYDSEVGQAYRKIK